MTVETVKLETTFQNKRFLLIVAISFILIKTDE